MGELSVFFMLLVMETRIQTSWYKGCQELVRKGKKPVERFPKIKGGKYVVLWLFDQFTSDSDFLKFFIYLFLLF